MSENGSNEELEFAHKPTPAAIADIVRADHTQQSGHLGDEISKGKSRIKHWELGGLIQKPARSESQNFPRVIDLASDLIASNLASLVDAPVVWQVPLVVEGEPPSLFMPVMSEDVVDITDPTNFANGEELSTTMVFEEWILNTDDQQRHFCAIETEAGREFRVIDHGHSLLQTLYRHNEGEVDGYENIHKSVGKNPYPFSDVEEVEDGISKVEAVTDNGINRVLSKSFQELHTLDTDDEDFVDFLEKEEDYKERLRRVLRERRDNIRAIMEDKLN